MFRRAVTAVALTLAVVALANSCTGSPTPVETTPTPLSDEQAFAAAEETYRAYVDALNQVDLSDPETFEPVYALTTGELNASDRKNFSAWHAEQVSITGTATIKTVAPVSASATSVEIEACYDITAVDVMSRDGVSIVDPNRPDVQALRIEQDPDGGKFRITKISPAEELTCAA